jgi:hypothetical protein
METYRVIDVLAKDHTLIETVSGNRFPTDANDWKWWHLQVPKRIKDLNSQGFVFRLGDIVVLLLRLFDDI